MKRSQDRCDDTYDPFNQGVDSTLRLLHLLAPLDTWMLTRVEGNEQIVVRADDHGYGIEAGSVFDWSNSFCIRMLEGRALRRTPRANPRMPRSWKRSPPPATKPQSAVISAIPSATLTTSCMASSAPSIQKRSASRRRNTTRRYRLRWVHSRP